MTKEEFRKYENLQGVVKLIDKILYDIDGGNELRIVVEGYGYIPCLNEEEKDELDALAQKALKRERDSIQERIQKLVAPYPRSKSISYTEGNYDIARLSFLKPRDNY